MSGHVSEGLRSVLFDPRRGFNVGWRAWNDDVFPVVFWFQVLVLVFVDVHKRHRFRFRHFVCWPRSLLLSLSVSLTLTPAFRCSIHSWGYAHCHCRECGSLGRVFFFFGCVMAPMPNQVLGADRAAIFGFPKPGRIKGLENCPCF